MLHDRRATRSSSDLLSPKLFGWILGATLVLAVACQTEPPPPVLPEGPHARQRADELRMALQEAQNAWSTGHRVEAKARVESAYQEWFEPLEPLLRRDHAVQTLELEFKFGSLARRMSRKGDPVALNDAVMELVAGVDTLVDTLPAPPADDVASAASATDALPIATEVMPPTRELTTYGDAKE